MYKQSVVLVLIGGIFCVLLANASAKEKQPNILFIMADDATYSDFSLYGGENVDTPNIDRLGREGLTFDQAYVSMSMCVPCRAELHTGLYPFRNGVAWNHSPAKLGIKSTPHYLNALGYRVGLAGKRHLQPVKNYPFEYVAGVEQGAVSLTAKYDAAPLREFMLRDPSQPFALTVAFNSPHAPWTVGDSSQFDTDYFILPPHIVDTPEVRDDFARYLAEIVVLDEQVGKTVDLLDELGIAGETLVFFSSEQGAQFPGCKWTNWSAGVKTAMIARWPDHVSAGGRTSAIVQYCDVLPTLIDVAGGDPSIEGFDGSSFLKALTGRVSQHREYAYFLHNNIPEGPSYPIRGVTDGKYHYIRNLNPERAYFEKHLFAKPDHTKYMSSILWTAHANKRTDKLLQRFVSRPAEELYDNEADPFQMENLAGETLPQLDQLRKVLDEWLELSGDPGSDLDSMEYYQEARKQAHPF